MSEVTIRPYEDRDEEGYYSVASLTYNSGVPVPDERRRNRFGTRYVAELAGEIAGIFTTLKMTATRGPSIYDCAAVAAVGVSPDLRRSGVGVEMMNWSVGHFRESGRPIASLYPFREPFYAKSGYAVCGKRLKISVPIHRLPKVESALPVTRLKPSDWQKLHTCYAEFAHARAGVHIRSELMWERVLAEAKSLTIYAVGDPVEGYVAVSHQVAFWEEQWLSEVAWSSAEGYRACLGIMHRLGINKTSVGWYEPSDSPFYANYLDQGVVIELHRPIMFRVCDAVAALQGLKPGATGSFSLRIDDPQIPENRGPFKVDFAPSGVTVTPHKIDSPDLVLTIGSFTQAFMGEPSLGELATFGSVVVNNRAALAQACLLLPPIPVYCGDFF